MTWATYATFCESPNPSAQTTHIDCLFPQTAEGSCICIPCRVWLWDLLAFPFLIQYLNCCFGGCFKPPEARPACQLAWPLLEISTSWKSEEPRWESLSAYVFPFPGTERVARTLRTFHPQAFLIGPAIAPLTGGTVAEYVLQIHCHENLTFIDETIIPHDEFIHPDLQVWFLAADASRGWMRCLPDLLPHVHRHA